MSKPPPTDSEWIEPDGLGGFAMGTAHGTRSRRYHSVLCVATDPPVGRVVLVNGFDAHVESEHGREALSTQVYAGGVESPDGRLKIVDFTAHPWPKTTYRLENGVEIEHEIFVRKDAGAAVLVWRARGLTGSATLEIRPFLSGRDCHALQVENPHFRMAADEGEGRTVFHPYDGVPATVVLHNGLYRRDAHWYRDFYYAEEDARGYPSREDCAAPGVFRFDLAKGEAVMILVAEGLETGLYGGALTVDVLALKLREAEMRRRDAFPSVRARAADGFIVRRNDGRTIIAGYPWFTDWGRDTFIALRGLCLATGRLDDARDILLNWAGLVDQGMLPNRFPDGNLPPEFNSVDAALWFIVAIHDYFGARKHARQAVPAAERTRLQDAATAILEGYAAGTRHGIRGTPDGLLAAGEPGVQLTWMDAKIGDEVVTPRIGKPVEVQALWLNALRIATAWDPSLTPAFEIGKKSFLARFWREDAGCLYDVVDVDHEDGRVDTSFRPNQVFAVGGLPFPLIEGARARRLVEAAYRELWTPAGPRSLAQNDAAYAGRYAGNPSERDHAYHQGTVWPWLAGAFIEARVRVEGGNERARKLAREELFEPLVRHHDRLETGQIAELADGEPPHTLRGCPFQAWSLGEILRLELDVLRGRKKAASS